MVKLIICFVEGRIMIEVTIHCKTHADALSYAEYPWVLRIFTWGELFSSVNKSSWDEVHADNVTIKLDSATDQEFNRRSEEDYKPVNWTLKQLAKNLKIKASCSSLILDEYHTYQII